MITFIRGKVYEFSSEHVILDNNGTVTLLILIGLNYWL